MKKIISIFAFSLLLFPFFAFAQIEFNEYDGQQMNVYSPPDGHFFSYQGVLHDADGLPVPDDAYVMTFTIYNSAEGGEHIWSETQSADVMDGVFTVLLGSETTMHLPFDQFYWLGVAVDGGEELLPRKLISPVPYSHFAQNVAADSITEDNISDGAVTESKIGDGAVTAEKLADDIKFTKYTQFDRLNTASVNIDDNWTKLNIGTRNFVKERENTVIEIFLYSRARSGTFSGAGWITYKLRVNEISPDMPVYHIIRSSETIEYITLKSIYLELPAGEHQVEVWARVNTGTSASVLIDPGGFQGSIIVKEQL